MLNRGENPDLSNLVPSCRAVKASMYPIHSQHFPATKHSFPSVWGLPELPWHPLSLLSYPCFPGAPGSVSLSFIGSCSKPPWSHILRGKLSNGTDPIPRLWTTAPSLRENSVDMCPYFLYWCLATDYARAYLIWTVIWIVLEGKQVWFFPFFHLRL